jgi:hypothetical protein
VNSHCVVTQEAVITINPADKAREAYRKDGSRFEEFLEAPFPRAASEFAEKAVDQTREAYERSSRTLEAAVHALEKAFDAAGHGAAALRRNIVDTAQRNLNLGFDLAQSLAGASNLFEIVELQAACWRKQVDAFTTQAEKARDGAPKKAESSLESIHHEPAQKSPPHGQETPKTGLGPSTRNSAIQKLDTSPATGPTVRPSDETQAGIRKKGFVRDESRKFQRSLVRDAAAEGGKQKPEPRPPSAPVAPPGVRPADERVSGIPKKGAARDEALQQSLGAGIKFGMLDGNPVRFTSLEAWWLVDGAWRPISPDEVLLNAAVMREARFNQFFPKVPRLPRSAFKADKFQN